MSELNESAAEHLQVIRQLMERATVYRAVSVPGALVGGVLALGLGAWQLAEGGEYGVSGKEFLVEWLMVLFLAGGFNVCMLKRGADARGEAFFSSGMKMGLGALLPPLGVGFVISVWMLYVHMGLMAPAVVWVLCYGAALHATGTFAPRSIRLLGLGFMVAGTGLMVLPEFLRKTDWLTGPVVMMLTFGLLHLVYAAGVWVRSPKKAA